MIDLLLKAAPWLITAAIGAVSSALVVRGYYSPRLTAAEARISELKTKVDSAGKQQEAKVEYVEREIVRTIEIRKKEDAAEIARLKSSLDIALNGLRDPGGRRSNLKAADSAPAQCGDYAASPTRLSVPDAEFLIREAAAANRLRVQWAGCTRDYEEVRARINSLKDSP